MPFRRCRVIIITNVRRSQLTEANCRTLRVTDLGRRGQTALRCIVNPIVNTFTQATRIGIEHQLSLRVEEADLLKGAVAVANLFSDRQLQARTHLRWAKNGAARLVLGVTT